jgi:hypothetical protein
MIFGRDPDVPNRVVISTRKLPLGPTLHIDFFSHSPLETLLASVTLVPLRRAPNRLRTVAQLRWLSLAYPLSRTMYLRWGRGVHLLIILFLLLCEAIYILFSNNR